MRRRLPTSRSARPFGNLEGYGYDISPLDVSNAYSFTMKAARNADRADEIQERVRQMVAAAPGEYLAARVLARLLGAA